MLMVQFPAWNTISLYSTIRLGLALILFFGIVPYLIFPRGRGESRSTLMQRALWMTFVTIAAVHFLTLAHMYSVFSLLAIYMGIAVWTLSRQFDRSSRLSLWFGLLALFGEAADSRAVFWQLVRGALATLYDRLLTMVREVGWRWIAAALVLVALGIAAWMRFVPVYHSAALPFSDSPLDLAWSKYPSLEILYHNKIYPRGLYVFMSAVGLLSGTNPIIVLRFFYPGLSVLVVAAAAYLVYRITDSLTAAAITAVLLGITRLLPYVNQGLFEGPISQQFGTAFTLLFIVFAIAYLQNGRRHDLTTAAVAGGLTAFIHPIPVSLVIVSTLALIPFSLLALGPSALRRIWHVITGVVLVAGLSVLPVTLALMQGQAWDGSAVSFLQTTTSGPSTTPPVEHDVLALGIALAVVALLSLLGVWVTRKRTMQSRWARQVMLAGIAGALIIPYLLPAVGLPSFVLAARSLQSLVIATALGAGLVWSLVEVLLASRLYLTVPITTAVVVGMLFLSPPHVDTSAAIYPYYANQMVYQTLRADVSFVPQSWTLVTGNTGYALVLGEAYHQYPQSFLALAKQLPQNPAKWVKAASRLGSSVSQHYVLMAEKVVPDAAQLPKPQVRSRLRGGVALAEWVAKNASRLHIHEVLDNSQLEVWYFTIPIGP